MKKKPTIDYEKVEFEYKPNKFSDTEEMYKIKRAIFKLTEKEKKMMILYTERGSYRAVSEAFNIPYDKTISKIKELKQRIKQCLN